MQTDLTKDYLAGLLPGIELGGLITPISYLLLLLSVCISHIHTCTFPDYVQSTVNSIKDARDWRAKIIDQNRHSLLKYSFNNDVIEVTSSDIQIKSHHRACVQSFDDHKFIIAYEEDGQPSAQYGCMQILKRSDQVIQIRQTDMDNTMNTNLCSEEQLRLDAWIIVDIKSIFSQRMDCPFSGGFNMQIYDKSNNRGLCDGYMGETRLESECLAGEGMNFLYRQIACVPDGLFMYASQRTYCLANWEDGAYAFVLLKHDLYDYLWILRYPQQLTATFTAFLMKDLFASPEDPITLTDNYLSLSMSQQAPKLLDSLCYDDYEICTVLRNPCNYSDEIARTCAKTCGFCSDSKPSVCQLPISLRQSWIDATQTKKGAVVQINSTAIDILGVETLHCIDWPDSFGRFKTKPGLEQMMVTVSDNGCQPKFSCARILQMPRNGLFMHLSQTRHWPLVEQRDDSYTCDNFIYKSEKPRDRNPYRTRQSNLFIPETINETAIQCDFTHFHQFNVHFSDGIRCSGFILQNSAKNALRFSFTDCPVQRLNQTYHCVDHSTAPARRDTVLITISNQSPPQVHCLLFPSNRNATFYTVLANDCNSHALRKIRRGRAPPYAIFSIYRKLENHTALPLTTNVPSTATSEIVSTLEGNDSEELTTQSTADKTTLSDNKTFTDTDAVMEQDDSNSNPSPLVVAAVVVTLIVIQIPVLCKCK